ncbi:MAG: hypothetical protein LC793_24835, partial [Thermomicrobia bacterium]|nr:hypothetical protein [Thermomicrobia bacterium]
MAFSCWATRFGQPLGDGPLLTAISGEIVLTELGQFNASMLVFPAADARVIAAMQPWTLLEIVQDGVGTLTYGYVLNPRQQITAQDQHTVTLTLEPLTVETMWETTHRGWTAANTLSVVAARLGALALPDPTRGLPGWTGRFTGAGTDADITVSVNLNDPTVQAGFLQVAKQFSQYARQGVDALGVPTRVLEMGQFGAAATIWLVSGDGADADEANKNPLIRLVATVDRLPNDVQQLTTVTTPFGGGSSSDALVTLERLWRIINDPAYPNFLRFGSDAQSMAYTGKPSLFPEYDPAYPISDPRNPPTGAIQRDAYGNLLQGVTGTRYPTLDGHWDYVVYDAAAYAAYGHKQRSFTDSSLTYADASPANQELTARALYIETITNFKRFSHPHHSFACTTPGVGRPTRAGDLIAADYLRASMDERGAVQE